VELQGTWEKALLQCRQGNAEKADAYALRLRLLARKLDYIDDVPDEFVSKIFLNGLEPSLQIYIRNYECDKNIRNASFEQRAQLASRYDSNRRVAGLNSTIDRHASATTHDSADRTARLERKLDDLAQLVEKLTLKTNDSSAPRQQSKQDF
jgi:hypothetical protein